MAASMKLLFRYMFNELIPHPVGGHLLFAVQYYFFKAHTPTLTLVIDESYGMILNQIYDAITSVYFCTKISPKTERLKINKSPKEKNLRIRLEKGKKYVDFYIMSSNGVYLFGFY
ncbi:hypothetical protein TIFTF001_031079 [Ficus carica]|uniref:AAA-type ATPase N-terminal domain-containing protein n=1 Tax=Ficus carica TaxID=3494 RepID=A0AA88J506_FICCA|nr:hypothetical protein TIFTF001_031079 [Ficus carica]